MLQIQPVMTLLMVICYFFAASSAASSVKYEAQSNKGALVQPDNYFPKVRLHTSMGDIVVELDRMKAPISSNNFLSYVVAGSYNNTIFHRVIPGFVVQGGGYTKTFEAKPHFGEILNESGNGLKNTLYTIAMARQNSPHSATRQFYFNLNDNENLDPNGRWGYAVFGYVTEGSEIIENMSQVDTQYGVELRAPDVPVKPIVLLKASLEGEG